MQVVRNRLMSIQVMLVERSLKYTSDQNDKKFKTSHDASLVESFLESNPTAKIIVVIDTHSEENGYFIWKGKESGYSACSLLEVRDLHIIGAQHLNRSFYRF